MYPLLCYEEITKVNMGSNDFRVKQMQLATSVERKTALKEQRNSIRKQLSTNSMLGKMKVNTPRKRSTSGPLKVTFKIILSNSTRLV